MIKLYKWIVDHVDSDIIMYSVLSVLLLLLCFLFWIISELFHYLGIDCFEALRLSIAAILLVILVGLVIFGVFFIIVAILAGAEKLAIKLFDKISEKYQGR